MQQGATRCNNLHRSPHIKHGDAWYILKNPWCWSTDISTLIPFCSTGGRKDIVYSSCIFNTPIFRIHYRDVDIFRNVLWCKGIIRLDSRENFLSFQNFFLWNWIQGMQIRPSDSMDSSSFLKIQYAPRYWIESRGESRVVTKKMKPSSISTNKLRLCQDRLSQVRGYINNSSKAHQSEHKVNSPYNVTLPVTRLLNLCLFCFLLRIKSTHRAKRFFSVYLLYQ